MATKVEKTDEQWRQELTPEQYEVTRRAATERAFTGPYWDEKAEGMYRCVCCGTELFSSGGGPRRADSPRRCHPNERSTGRGDTRPRRRNPP